MLINILAISILLLIMLAFAVICHFIAKWRGGKPSFYGALGFMFGPLAIPFALFPRKWKR
jgi:hypothetical protein